jgi:large subunit ribosomal protein L23
MQSINKPIITEKTLQEARSGRYAFEVEIGMNKNEIKRVTEKMFGVNVINVKTMRVPGKTYRTGKKWIKRERHDWKKAFVAVKEGQKISLFDTKTS